MIAEAMASDIGGTATLVGDPPNIIIASRAGLTFNDFLVHLTPLVIVLTAVFIGLCRLLFRKAFRYDPERAAIQDKVMLVQSLSVLGVVIAAFVLHPVLHYEPSGGDHNVLWWALALGADLGGNATAVGASANVVILGIAERNGARVSFWQFTKYGLVVTVVTVALCVPYLWLRYLL
ncbi:SLC13 family permease [Microbispora sp. NPDC046973]|uniref:SLC13 family permease n=1 Tax=Microbispora sp. NPDC046973 TaxID=3155022 RepID=UPI0033CD9A33